MALPSRLLWAMVSAEGSGSPNSADAEQCWPVRGSTGSTGADPQLMQCNIPWAGNARGSASCGSYGSPGLLWQQSCFSRQDHSWGPDTASSFCSPCSADLQHPSPPEPWREERNPCSADTRSAGSPGMSRRSASATGLNPVFICLELRASQAASTGIDGSITGAGDKPASQGFLRELGGFAGLCLLHPASSATSPWPAFPWDPQHWRIYLLVINGDVQETVSPSTSALRIKSASRS